MSAVLAIGWAVFALFVFQLLVQLTTVVREHAQFDVVSTFGCQLAAYLLAIFLILEVHAPDASIRDFLALRPTHPALYVLGFLFGMAALPPISALHEFIIKRHPLSHPDELTRCFLEASFSKRLAIATVLVACVPVLEETFFRGALYRPLRRAYPAAVAVTMTAALFAIAHLEWQTVIPISLVGVSLGVLRSASGSIVPSSLAHVAFNGLSMFGLATGTVDESASDRPLPVAMVVGSAAVALASLGLAALIARRSAVATSARDRDAR